MLFLLSIVKCEMYYVRQYKSDMFVSIQTTNTLTPALVTFESADAFEVSRSKDKMEEFGLKVVGMENLVWDIAGGATKLIYYGFHGGKNQRFKLVPVNCEGVFNIVWDDKCITYQKEKMGFELEKCEIDAVKQQFEFLNVNKFRAYLANGGDVGGSSGGAMGEVADGLPVPSSESDLAGMIGHMLEMLKDVHQVVVDHHDTGFGFGLGFGSFGGNPPFMQHSPFGLGKFQTTLQKVSSLCSTYNGY